VTEPHPTTGLTEVVHQRARLGVLTVLAESGEVEFGYLRGVLELTDGNLGRHLTVLAEQDLITVRKGHAGRRPRTWVAITPAGRRALAAELDALRELVRRLDTAEALRNLTPQE